MSSPAKRARVGEPPERAPTEGVPPCGEKAAKEEVEEEEEVEDLAEADYAEQLLAAQNVQDGLAKVENKFNALRAPLWRERDAALRVIPCFWARVLSHFAPLADVMSDSDDLLLSFVESMEIVPQPDINDGFDITFHFSANDLLKETRFTKELRWLTADADAGGDTKGRELRHTTRPAPTWRPGKDLTSVDVTRKMGLESNVLRYFAWFFSSGVGNERAEGGRGADYLKVTELLRLEVWLDPMKWWDAEDDDFDDELDDEVGEEEEEGEEDEEGGKAGRG